MTFKDSIICKDCPRRSIDCSYRENSTEHMSTCTITDETCVKSFVDCPTHICSLAQFCSRAYELGKQEWFSTGMKRGFLNARIPHRSDTENIMLLSADYQKTMQEITRSLMGPKGKDRLLNMIPIFNSIDEMRKEDLEEIMENVDLIITSYNEYDNNTITTIRLVVDKYIMARLPCLNNNPIEAIGFLITDPDIHIIGELGIRWNKYFKTMIETLTK